MRWPAWLGVSGIGGAIATGTTVWTMVDDPEEAGLRWLLLGACALAAVLGALLAWWGARSEGPSRKEMDALAAEIDAVETSFEGEAPRR